MLRLAPLLPSDELRIERERVAKKRPHLALASSPERPEPDHFRWWSVAELMERGQ